MSPRRRREPPRFYFNLRSPYSWLAVGDLLAWFPDVAAAVEWRPFWEPGPRDSALLRAAGGEFPYAPMSKDKHLYILQDVKRLAAERNRTIHWPVDSAPRWEVAHHPFFAARRAGLGAEYVRAVGAARWEQGRDISDPEQIVAIAAGLGLDPAAARGAIDAEETAAEATAALLDVYRDGVFGVPFFIAGREKYWGIDRLERFVHLVRGGTGHAGPAPEAGQPPGFDDGHPGGCG